jgi:alcohol dehydrogenase
MEYLQRAIEDGRNDREARERMAWANTLGGIVIGEGNSGTVAIHALGHSIGGQTDAPHGLTMCPLAVPYVKRAWETSIDKFAVLTRIFGYGEEGMSKRELASLCPDAIKSVLAKFGCDLRMRDLGVTEGMIGPMTDSVFNTMAGVLNNSTCKLGRDDVVAMYRECL